jgi:hypothetical protein
MVVKFSYSLYAFSDATVALTALAVIYENCGILLTETLVSLYAIVVVS